jgi:hypothetical protein
MTIDTSAPAAPTNLSWKTSTNVTVPNNGFTNVAGGTASWQASSSGDVDHYVYKYWNDIVGNPYKVGHEYTVNLGGTSLPGTFNQGEGVHHFCVEAVDHAGNTSACTEFTITYDKTNPSVTFTDPSAGDVRHNLKISVNMDGTGSNLVQYGFDVTGPNGVHFSTANYHIDQATKSLTDFDLCAAANYGTCPSTLPDGTYTVRAKAYDAAGNRNITTTLSFVIDNTSPTATIDAYNGADTTPTLTGTVNDPTASLTVAIDGGTAAAATNNGDGTWSFTVPTALSAGTHTIVLTATDTAGNSYQTTANVTVVAPNASQTGIDHSQGNGNSDQATGHQATVTVTPNNDGKVLGAETDNSNLPKVEFNPASNKVAVQQTSSNFLGLGWWWLAVLAVLAIFLALIFRKADSNKQA